MRLTAAVFALVLLAGCGDDEPDTSRSAFVDWVNAGGGDAGTGECVADRLYDQLSNGDLEELLELDADSSESEWRAVPAAERVAATSFDCAG